MAARLLNVCGTKVRLGVCVIVNQCLGIAQENWLLSTYGDLFFQAFQTGHLVLVCQPKTIWLGLLGNNIFWNKDSFRLCVRVSGETSFFERKKNEKNWCFMVSQVVTGISEAVTLEPRCEVF